jgi:hypothetical protein
MPMSPTYFDREAFQQRLAASRRKQQETKRCERKRQERAAAWQSQQEREIT